MNVSHLALRVARALMTRVPPVRRLARSLHESFAAERAFEVDLPELTPIAARRDEAAGRVPADGVPAAHDGGRSGADAPPLRLNLLLPGASPRHVFGGAATALALFEALHRGEQRRILVTDERELESVDPRRFAGWEVVTLDSLQRGGPASGAAPVLIPMAERGGRTLPIHANDRFMATAWWTAHHARALARWQKQAFGLVRTRPFIYLIQDYEPGFYPWSARFALADQTYGFGEEAVAVFNTLGLRRYVAARHAAFAQEFVFEPVLNAELAGCLADAASEASPGISPRQRRILIYGRPSVPRNAFALIVQGLRQWVAADPAASGWSVVSLGEAHPDVPLGAPPGALRPVVIASRGKVGLPEYAALMRESAIGIGLMLSPHPSYPPLEMAAFGMRVLTNRFEGKALGEQHPNIHDLPEPTPQAIAAGLSALVSRFEFSAGQRWSDPAGPFARARAPFDFIEPLRAAWLAEGSGSSAGEGPGFGG